MKQETCFYSYHVVVKHRHSGERFNYRIRSRAYRLYRFLLEHIPDDPHTESVHFACCCQRYDNSGNLYFGFGDTKKSAYNDSIFHNNDLPF